MTQSSELSLAITTVAALVVVTARKSPTHSPAVLPEPRRVMFASGRILKRRGEKLRWS